MNITTSKVVEIIGIIVGLIFICIHVEEIKATIGLWGLYLIILAILVVLIVLPEIIKGMKIKDIVGPFFKYAVLLYIVTSFVDNISKQTPIEPSNPLIIHTIGFWHLILLSLIGIILTIEQKRGAVDKDKALTASFSPLTSK